VSKKPLPRIIAGAVITTVAAAAFLTFTRGDTPQTDTAAALLPGVSDTAGPIVEGSTPTPSSPASADATERAAETAAAIEPSEAPRTTSSSGGGTTKSPKPRANDPDPTQAPSPTPTPTQDCDLLSAILGGCK